MVSDPYVYYQQFEITAALLKKALPKAHTRAIRTYIIKRIQESLWSADHVMSVIQAQARLGIFIYVDGEVKVPPDFPENWIDAPIIGIIEISDRFQLSPKERELMARGLFVEHLSPWYIKYFARIKRWFVKLFKGFVH